MTSSGSQEELMGIISQNNLLQAVEPSQTYRTIELLQQQVKQLQAEKVELIQQHKAELERIALQQSTIEQTQTKLAEYQQTEQELQRANQALCRSFATNRALLNAIPDLILRLSRDGKLVNYKAAKDCEMPFHPCQFLGKSLDEMFPREVAEQAMACVEQSLTTEETQSFEFQLSWNFQSRLYEARFAVSDIDEVIVLVRDITERKQAETELIVQSKALANFSSNLKRLHRLSTTNYQDIEYLFADYLQTGCEIFGLPTGIITKIDDSLYNFRSIISDFESLIPYLFVELQNTYCAVAAKEKNTIFYNSNVRNKQEQRSSKNFKLNSYICTPIFVNNKIYGTLSFSSTKPRSSNFRTDEQEMIELMAQSIGKFIATNQMVMEQQLAEEALRESEQRFRQMAENIRQVFWVKDIHKEQMIYISPAYEEIWGRSCQSMYRNSQSFLDSIHPEDRKRAIAALKQQKQGKYDIEYRIVQLTGQERWIRDRAFPIRDSEGRIFRLVGIAEDVTEYKRAEQEVRKALEQEKELSDLKSRFVSMTSHEFRTPLATILSSAELLQHYQHKWTEQKKQVHFERIYTSVQHMTQMLDDVLFWSKIEAKKLKLQPSWFDLILFCNSLIEELEQSEGKEHQIIFHWSSQELDKNYQLVARDHWGKIYNQPHSSETTSLGARNQQSRAEATSAVAVTADPQLLVCLDQKLLRHILSNLLSNAIKYSPDNSKIELEVACEEGEVIFQIQDYGIGIPPEDLPHLFESFHRGENVDNIPGTGLGLAIVKKSVDLHSGQITVNSKVGVGTTFTVKISANYQYKKC